jgi:hypothetical protein
VSGRGVLLAAGIAGAFLALALSASASWLRDDPAPGRNDFVRASAGAGGLRISGSVGGLYPGSIRPLRVRIDNLRRRPLIVRSLRAVPRAASRRCPAATVRIAPHRRSMRVPPRSRRWIRLRISMRPDAANACQGARFPIAYRAKVRR